MSLLLTFNNENCTKDKCFCNVSDDQLYACREEAIHDWTKQIFNDGGDTLRLVCEYGYNFETHQVRHIITEAKLNLWIPTMDLNYIHLYILNEGCYAEDLFFSFMATLSDFFRTPNFKIAAKFSHDIEPQYLSKIIANELPFGVHAWSKYDRNFWVSHPQWPVLSYKSI